MVYKMMMQAMLCKIIFQIPYTQIWACPSHVVKYECNEKCQRAGRAERDGAGQVDRSGAKYQPKHLAVAMFSNRHEGLQCNIRSCNQIHHVIYLRAYGSHRIHTWGHLSCT
jgi:hypothetical protein